MQATTRDGGDSRKALLPWPATGLAVASTGGAAGDGGHGVDRERSAKRARGRRCRDAVGEFDAGRAGD